MVDIYNEKLEKYADHHRHIFTAKYSHANKHEGIFQDLTVNNEDNVVVQQIALRLSKSFQNLQLQKGDVVQFEALVKKNNRNEFMVERPTRVEKIASAAPQDKGGVHVVGDNWDWFKN